MKLNEVKIEPLRKDEKNQLHGGFDFVSLAKLEDAGTNGLCIKNDNWPVTRNDNCSNNNCPLNSIC